MSIVDSFLWSNKIPFYGSNTFSLSIEQLIDLGWFYFCATVNRGAMDLHIQFLVWIYVPISGEGIYVGVELMSRIVTMFTFFGVVKQYVSVTASFYILTAACEGLGLFLTMVNGGKEI